jgi:hypothetical protein
MGSISITSWLRAFFALQEHALDARGADELRHDDEVVRWPRTRAADVAAIVALLDPCLRGGGPCLRGRGLRFGGHGLPRRWRACIDGLARHPGELEYRVNRAFWRTLPAICLYLHSHSVPLPPLDVWRALVARFRVERATAVAPLSEIHDRTD